MVLEEQLKRATPVRQNNAGEGGRWATLFVCVIYRGREGFLKSGISTLIGQRCLEVELPGVATVHKLDETDFFLFCFLFLFYSFLSVSISVSFLSISLSLSSMLHRVRSC